MAQPTPTEPQLSQQPDTAPFIEVTSAAGETLTEDSFAGSDSTHNQSTLARDRELREHLASLSLTSIQEYIAWCEKHGFSAAIKKNWKQRCKEKYFASKCAIEDRRKNLKKEKRRPARAIAAAFSKTDSASFETASPWARRIKTLADSMDEATRTAFRRIVEQLEATKSSLLKSDKTFKLDGGPIHLIPVLQYPEFETPQNSYIEALATISLYPSCWIRPVESWKPTSRNFAKQFESLVRHLFAKYPIATFMDCVWFEGNVLKKNPRHDWFIKLAGGTSVRKLDLPVPLTRRMAHHFCKTPKGLGIMAAIRRAQLHACGGSDQLLTGLLSTRIATSTEHNEFWLTVIQWLVDHPMLHSWRFGPIVDFFHHMKFELVEEGQSSSNFSPHKLTPDRVMQEMLRWHAGMRKTEVPEDEEWARHPTINPFHFVESAYTTWEIKQLLSVRQLQMEGKQLRHCVLSYAKHCSSGATTIWSLTVQRKSMSRQRKVLTIEVSPNSGRIVQIRGRANRNGRKNELAVIRRWAQIEGLHMR